MEVPQQAEIRNPEGRAFFEAFISARQVNRDCYERIPEDKLDFRMVDTLSRHSDSPRESIVHQIATTRDYIHALLPTNGAKYGEMRYGGHYVDLDKANEMTKAELLQMLDATQTQLQVALSNMGEREQRLIKVPWAEQPVPLRQVIWGLRDHEILHTGWNLAIMDHLDIPRFPSLQQTWGE